MLKIVKADEPPFRGWSLPERNQIVRAHFIMRQFHGELELVWGVTDHGFPWASFVDPQDDCDIVHVMRAEDTVAIEFSLLGISYSGRTLSEALRKITSADPAASRQREASTLLAQHFRRFDQSILGVLIAAVLVPWDTALHRARRAQSVEKQQGQAGSGSAMKGSVSTQTTLEQTITDLIAHLAKISAAIIATTVTVSSAQASERVAAAENSHDSPEPGTPDPTPVSSEPYGSISDLIVEARAQEWTQEIPTPQVENGLPRGGAAPSDVEFVSAPALFQTFNEEEGSAEDPEAITVPERGPSPSEPEPEPSPMDVPESLPEQPVNAPTIGNPDDFYLDMLFAGLPVLEGEEGDDVLVGGEEADVIIGHGGQDTLIGGMGDDILIGGEGDDSLQGDEGDDSLFGGSGQDMLVGGLGDDMLAGGSGNDDLQGNEGDDLLFGGDGEDTLQGDEGADTLHGNEGNDVLGGDEGDDHLFGGDGADTLDGDQGDDLLWGNNGHDLIRGGLGNDVIHGNVGGDTVDGGEGSDTIYLSDEVNHGRMWNTIIDTGSSGYDKLVLEKTADGTFEIQGTFNASASGIEEIDGSGVTDEFISTRRIRADFNFSDIKLTGIDQIQGSLRFSDRIIGSAGDDLIVGLGGNDNLIGGLGNDTIDGGEGRDRLQGLDGDDLLIGGSGKMDKLFGGLGSDILYAGVGRDYIDGGDAKDTGADHSNDIDIVVYDGQSNDYIFVYDGDNQYTVTHITTGHVDTVRNVEQVLFIEAGEPIPDDPDTVAIETLVEEMSG